MTEPLIPAPAPATANKSGRLSLAFALFILVFNILSNLVTGALLGPDASPTAAWVSVVIHLVVVIALAVLAFWFGARCLRETAGGTAPGRGYGIVGIVVAAILLLFTLGATAVQIVGAYAS